MKRTILILLVTTVALFVGYIIYMQQVSGPAAGIKHIEVEIVKRDSTPQFMDAEDVREELARKRLNVMGMSMDSVDVNHVEQSLRENPLFADVEVSIQRLKRTLRVVVQQRQAAFMVQTPQRSYYVSRERGVIPVNPNYMVYVPVVSGAVTEDEAKTTIFDLIEAIHEDDYFRHYFGHIYVDRQRGIILSPRVGTASIIMGHHGDWRMMLAKLRIFDERVVAKRGWSAFEYIKLTYGDQIVARTYSARDEAMRLKEQQAQEAITREATPRASEQKPEAKPQKKEKKPERKPERQTNKSEKPTGKNQEKKPAKPAEKNKRR